jgi:hypothetical protein
MRNLRANVDAYHEMVQPDDAAIMQCIADLAEITTLMEKEGLSSVRLSIYHVERAKLFRRLGDRTSQFRCLREARKVRHLCIGPLHPFSIRLAKEIEDLARQLGHN